MALSGHPKPPARLSAFGQQRTDTLEPIGRIVREIVHINVLPEEISAAEDEPVLIDWRELRDGDGSGGPNKDTARTKR